MIWVILDQTASQLPTSHVVKDIEKHKIGLYLKVEEADLAHLQCRCPLKKVWLMGRNDIFPLSTPAQIADFCPYDPGPNVNPDSYIRQQIKALDGLFEVHLSFCGTDSWLISTNRSFPPNMCERLQGFTRFYHQLQLMCSSCPKESLWFILRMWSNW